MAIKSISFRIDSELLDKLHFIAKHEGRSANGQVIQIIKKEIREFEKEHGPIDFKQELE